MGVPPPTTTSTRPLLKAALTVVTAAIWGMLLLRGVWPVALLLSAGVTLAVASLAQAQGWKLPAVVTIGIVAGVAAFLRVNR